MDYKITKIDSDNNVCVTLTSKDVKIPTGRQDHVISGLDLTNADTLKADLESYVKSFAAGLAVEEDDAPSAVPKDITALVGKSQTVDVTED